MSKFALVVDDSRTVREMVSHALRQAGFESVTCGNGQEGLEKLAAQPVSLIITDLNMPVMDGLAFIRAVRCDAQHRGTPILMLTAEEQSDSKAEGEAAGASGWLVKPFSRAMLLQAVGKVVPGS